MPVEEPPRDDAGTGPDAEERRRRRRRLAEVFGEVLPSQTSDDVDAPADRTHEGAEDGAHEEWLRRQVPPHHG